MPRYIYINGYPGVGKLTVAKELEKLLPGSRVYHNHLLIDPVAAAVDRDSPHYDAMRTGLRRYLLDMIATSEATQHVAWIFTDSRDTSEAASAAARDYENAAIKRGVPFVPVVLHCDLDENMKRIVSEERGLGSHTKLTDLDILRSIRQHEDLHRFGDKRELELNITNMAPTEAARTILEHAEKVADSHHDEEKTYPVEDIRGGL